MAVTGAFQLNCALLFFVFLDSAIGVGVIFFFFLVLGDADAVVTIVGAVVVAAAVDAVVSAGAVVVGGGGGDAGVIFAVGTGVVVGVAGDSAVAYVIAVLFVLIFAGGDSADDPALLQKTTGTRKGAESRRGSVWRRFYVAAIAAAAADAYAKFDKSSAWAE